MTASYSRRSKLRLAEVSPAAIQSSIQYCGKGKKNSVDEVPVRIKIEIGGNWLGGPIACEMSK